MKTTQEILIDFNDALGSSNEVNEQCLKDNEFAKIAGAQWAGSDREQFKNKPKPENNKLFKNINRLLGQYQRMEMNARIASASDEATDEDADLLQGRWRNDFNMSDGVEALNNAADEAFFGGFGAVKLVAKYEDEENPKPENQYLCIEPIYSAPSSVVYSAGAIRKDKQDANQAWHLVRVNRKAIEEAYGVDFSSFPEATSNVFFNWLGDTTKDVYVAHYYEVIEKTINEFKFNIDGMDLVITTGDGIKDQMGNKITRDELAELKEALKYEQSQRKIKYVEYALMSGDKFLIKPTRTPFKSIPIIPQYGYHTVINGVEYYCGEVCRQRDNQRFENMGFGALMEIMAQNQKEIPEYTPEQINRHSSFHANKDLDNPAYLLSDPVKDANGNPIHFGPIGKHMPPQIGSGLASALQYLGQNIAEQAGNGVVAPPSNTAADAIRQVNERQDDAFQPLFQNAVQTIKAACKVWLPAAQKIYFSGSRSIRIQGPDQSYSQVETLEYAVTPEGYGPYKNAARGKYDVTVKVGESHKSVKEAEAAAARELLQYTDTATPMGQAVLMSAIQATTGEGMATVRKMARFNEIKVMLMEGIDPDIKNDEEQAFAQRTIQQMQAAQQSQQNPQAMLAQAEAQARMMEGQAAIQNEVNDAKKNEIEVAKLQLKDKELNIKAVEAGVDIENTQAKTQGEYLDQNIKLAKEITGR